MLEKETKIQLRTYMFTYIVKKRYKNQVLLFSVVGKYKHSCRIVWYLLAISLNKYSVCSLVCWNSWTRLCISINVYSDEDGRTIPTALRTQLSSLHTSIFFFVQQRAALDMRCKRLLHFSNGSLDSSLQCRCCSHLILSFFEICLMQT